jgi:hypothetical protein
MRVVPVAHKLSKTEERRQEHGFFIQEAIVEKDHSTGETVLGWSPGQTKGSRI